MKKSLYLIPLYAFAIIYSSASYASGGEGRGHREKHHNRHYTEQPSYYPEQAQYADPRSHQGLAGGVVGSVLGYEIGNGNPIATGVGAAAGSYLGNGIAGRR